jgi:alpha-tubulin suppressor-like RCC1 family protein
LAAHARFATLASLAAHARLAALASLAVLAAAFGLGGLVGCHTEIPDGYYRCDPTGQPACPPGYHCLRKGTSQVHYCYRDNTAYCGDGVRDPEQGEECDGQDVVQLCTDGEALCRENCTVVCTLCGNGIAENERGQGEQCDGADLDGQTCQSMGFAGGTLACNDDCGYDLSGCSTLCGNGVIDEDEQCDATRLGGADCVSAGYWYGTLRCGLGCVWDTSACVGAVDLAPGSMQLCLLDSNGQTRCRGDNYWGALGSGLSRGIHEWGPVVDDPHFVRLEGGFYHVCGLDGQGAMWCWGANEGGQLGNSSVVSTARPVQVYGDFVFTDMGVGIVHTCGLRTDQRVLCWGDNSYGQLGDGSTTPVAVPTADKAVAGGHVFTQVAGGGLHNCALDADGAIWCWGDNAYGQLGDATFSERTAPVKIESADDDVFIEVAAGWGQSCGLRADGQLFCWGDNRYGALGDGTQQGRNVPVEVAGAHSFSAVECGLHSTCGVSAEGTGWCWGRGPLGDGSADASALTPVAVDIAERLKRIEMGRYSRCAQAVSQKPLCWGWNGAGQLAAQVSNTAPRRARPELRFHELDVGTGFLCGVERIGEPLPAEGAPWCWGDLDGLGSQVSGDASAFGLLSVSSRTDITSVAAGARHICVATKDMEVWCLGDNSFGQLGDTTTTSRWALQPVAGAHTFSAVYAGGYQTCAITQNDGAVYCWGCTQSSALGDACVAHYTQPEASLFPTAAFDVAVGQGHLCIVEWQDGGVFCQGWGRYGQLGNGETRDATLPVPVVLDVGDGSPLDFCQVSVGNWHTCGLDLNGGVWCWGNNTYGQLGDGSGMNQVIPVRLDSALRFADVACGTYHTCAVDSDGAAWCWGNNDYGQLGDTTTDDRATPVSVTGGHVFEKLAVGALFTCGLKQDGTLWCWGQNAQGQLGTGDYVLVPQEVSPP